MVPALSMNIYDSERCNVIHSHSCLHVFYHTQSSQNQSNHQFMTFIDMFVILYKTIEVILVSKKIVSLLICLTISTCFNFDVFHAVPV